MQLSKHAYRALIVLGIAGLSAACDKQPSITGPSRAARAAHAAPASHSAATITSGTGTFSFDRVHYWGCVGEMVHNVFQVSFTWTKVETPTGEYLYREPWHVNGVVGSITGLSSGTVWLREHVVSPYIERSMGGGMVEYTGHVRFVSETGPTIQVNELFDVSSNANGETTVDFYKSDCVVEH